MPIKRKHHKPTIFAICRGRGDELGRATTPATEAAFERAQKRSPFGAGALSRPRSNRRRAGSASLLMPKALVARISRGPDGLRPVVRRSGGRHRPLCGHKTERVAHSFFFRSKVGKRVLRRLGLAGNFSDNIYTALSQGARLAGIVRKKPDAIDAKLPQNCNRQAEISLVSPETERAVGVDCVKPRILERIGLQLRGEGA